MQTRPEWLCARRIKFFWRDGLIVTDPAALGAIMGRGEGALDKAAEGYAPINQASTYPRNREWTTPYADLPLDAQAPPSGPWVRSW